MKGTEILFFGRPFPSANSMVIRDDQSFLVILDLAAILCELSSF